MGDAPPASLPDPFALCADQLQPLDGSLRELVGSDHPVLTRVAQHFFELAGKRFRPTVVLLASSAAAAGQPASDRQVRLAEIAEMIHAASLLHDDVIDLADTRRGAKAAHRIYGNKVAVLAGDFLLARASVLLSRLGDVRVVELLATVIEEMVQGELMQVKAMPHELLEFDHYLSKTYRKTAALMALSCQASALLGQQPPEVESAMQAYGRHLGIAYQVVDDLLDFTGSTDALGKPALSDMEQGLATAPTLFAAEEFPEIIEIVQRCAPASRAWARRERDRLACTHMPFALARARTGRARGSLSRARADRALAGAQTLAWEHGRSRSVREMHRFEEPKMADHDAAHRSVCWQALRRGGRRGDRRGTRPALRWRAAHERVGYLTRAAGCCSVGSARPICVARCAPSTVLRCAKQESLSTRRVARGHHRPQTELAWL